MWYSTDSVYWLVKTCCHLFSYWCWRRSMDQMHSTDSDLIRWNGRWWNRTLSTGLTQRQTSVESYIENLCFFAGEMYLTCRMGSESFRRWFDVNRPTFDEEKHEKRFFFTFSFPVTLTLSFDLRITPPLTSVRGNFCVKYKLSTMLQYSVNEGYVTDKYHKTEHVYIIQLYV